MAALNFYNFPKRARAHLHTAPSICIANETVFSLYDAHCSTRRRVKMSAGAFNPEMKRGESSEMKTFQES